jgi:membrane protein DedA with SNARE-associated domain
MTDDPLGDILLCAASLGLIGIFAVALFERLVPILPSHGLYAAIGIAAAEGAWSLPAAMFASVLGSGTGAFAAYRLGLHVAAHEGLWRRIHRLLRRRDRLGRFLRSTQRRSATVPFVAQLLPAARLLPPLIAGAMPHDRRRLATATLAGLTVWNVTFIAFGFAMVRVGGTTNATAVSMTIVVLLACVLITTRLARCGCKDAATDAPCRPTFRSVR